MPDVGDARTGITATEVVARAERTLTASSARIAFEQSWIAPKPAAQTRRRRGGLVRLLLWPVKLIFRMAWRRVSGGRRFGELSAKGILEPPTGRYMLDYGSFAEIYEDGVTFGGRSGRALETLKPFPARPNADDPLWLLRLALGVVEASDEGDELLHGTRSPELRWRFLEAGTLGQNSGRTSRTAA